MIIKLGFWVIPQLAFDWGMGSFGYSSMVLSGTTWVLQVAEEPDEK